MFQGEDPEAKVISSEVLLTCLHSGLRLLHPFMPFLTEELYQRLPRRSTTNLVPSICVESYPEVSEVVQAAKFLGVKSGAFKFSSSMLSINPSRCPACGAYYPSCLAGRVLHTGWVLKKQFMLFGAHLIRLQGLQVCCILLAEQIWQVNGVAKTHYSTELKAFWHSKVLSNRA